MTWNFLDNTDQRECSGKQQWVKVAMGNTQSFGIDNFGRLFSWGGNGGSGIGMTGHHSDLVLDDPETYEHDRDIDPLTEDEMMVTKQLGTAHNWVDVQNGEYHTVALNELGELWIVGSVYDGVAGTSVGSDHLRGLFDYSNTTKQWTRNGSINAFTLLDLTKITNGIGVPYWDAFALGWTHIIGLYNGTAYVWGTNELNNFGDNYEVVDEDVITYEAVPITWIPGDPQVKLVAANQWASVVVTEDDEIYWWGDSVNDDTVATPTLVGGITIPVGETITQIDITNASGMVVLLSDGSVWGNGYFNMGAASPSFITDFTHLVDFPKAIRVEVEGFTLGVLTELGDIYAIGGFNWFLSRSDASSNITDWDDIYLVQADYPGELHATYFSIGVFSANAYIDSNGDLWTWGQNNYGMLALDESSSVISDSSVAQKAAPAVSWRGASWLNEEGYEGVDVVSLNSDTVTGESSYTAVEEYLVPPYSPHWHKQLFDWQFLSDCWRPVVAIDGEYVHYVACGNNLYNFMMLQYRIDANVWEILYTGDENSILCCEMEGGAAIKEPVYCFHNWKEDVTLVGGDRFSATFSGAMFATWVIDNTSGSKTLNYTEWAGSNKLHGRNKIACNESGMVACIVETSTDWDVYVSEDFGATWASRKNLAYSALRTDFGLVIDELHHIYIFYYNSSTNAITCERSTDNGLNWNTQGTISGVLTTTDITRLECSVQSGSELHVSIEDGLGEAEFYYSTNAGVSWTTRSLPTGRLFYMADPSDASLYNMEDEAGVDQFTENYKTASPSFAGAAGTPDENGITYYTITDRGYLKNSGQYGVHANRYSVYRARGLGDYGNE